MLVFELTYPGVWLDLPDRERAFQLERLLHLLEANFVDASVALNLFLAAQAQAQVHGVPSRDDWERDAARRRELTQQLEHQLGVNPLTVLNREVFEEIRERADLELKREHWAAGRPPQQYAFRPLSLHARSFIYALDTIGNTLEVLQAEPDVPTEVKTQTDAFFAAFPSVVGVRDSAHHPEDRGRGLGKWGKPLTLKAVDNQLIKAPGGVLALDCLNGNKYGCTMADGHYGEVEVSPDSLSVVQTCVQKVFDAFPWKGPRRHIPA